MDKKTDQLTKNITNKDIQTNTILPVCIYLCGQTTHTSGIIKLVITLK